MWLLSLEEKLIKDFLSLPDERKKEVMEFVESLKKKSHEKLESMMDDIISENKEALKELSK